jgi:hypothetical protein
MVFMLDAHWLADEIDKLVPEGDQHRAFLAKKARVGLMGLGRQGIFHKLSYAVVCGSFVGAEETPKDINIILFVKNLLAEERDSFFVSRNNPGYPQAEISICNLDDSKEMSWAMGRLAVTKERHGITPVMFYPETEEAPDSHDM